MALLFEDILEAAIYLLSPSSMAIYMKEGLKALRIILESINGCIIKFISNLSKEFMDGSIFYTLTGSFEDDNTWGT